EADIDARGDVAVLLRGDAHAELAVGRLRMLGAQVDRLAARAAGEPGEAEPRGERRRDPAGGDEAVLQAGVLVVERAQLEHLALERPAIARHLAERGGARVRGQPARR